MKKIFAKELAALAVLAIAFTGCNTAFDGTNANFSEKEAQYTDYSGATQSFGNLGNVTVAGELNVTNKKNEITVTVSSFSKINLESADAAIKFQRLTKNATNDYYYPTRGTELPKTRVKANENAGTTVITYEVDATGVTEDRVAFFVDATKLKTKGGTPVLALDNNLKRGEESDSIVTYTNATTFTLSGVTSPVSTGNGQENFRPGYNPIVAATTPSYSLTDASNKPTGVTRIQVGAKNKKNTLVAGSADDWENGLAAKLNEAVVLQYREPGKREYSEKKLSWTYHDADSTAAYNSDPYEAHAYTADFGPFEPGTEYRVVQTKPEGITVPAWYKEAYGHEASYYYGYRAGAKSTLVTEATFTRHATVPTYIVVDRTEATTGPDATSSYTPYSPFAKSTIKTAQSSFFTVTYEDNWIKVTPSSAAVRDILDPATTKDFIVVDANNKKIAADVEVITYSYNDSNTASGKVNYVKVTLKDVRYRNYTTAIGGTTTNPGALKVLVGSGTKIKENKKYPAQLAFGQWKDVTDDDASGYVQIN